MNELQIIDERELLGKDFRIYGTFDKPLFLAKDVANWIDNSNVTMMLKNIDEDEKVKISPKQSLGLLTPNNEYNFLTEDGLYEVLMQSRKPIAKQFKKQVKEILKTIRKTGGYVSNDDMFINTYLPFADDNTKLMFKSTLETVRKQNELIQQQKETINNQVKEIEHKENVIIGMTKDIDLAEKRQRISQIVKHNSKNYQERYGLLYNEFNKKYHIDIKTRLANAKERKEVKKSMNQMEYICKVMNMTNELYDLCCKLFEGDFVQLLDEWKDTVLN